MLFMLAFAGFKAEFDAHSMHLSPLLSTFIITFLASALGDGM